MKIRLLCHKEKEQQYTEELRTGRRVSERFRLVLARYVSERG